MERNAAQSARELRSDLPKHLVIQGLCDRQQNFDQKWHKVPPPFRARINGSCEGRFRGTGRSVGCFTRVVFDPAWPG